MKPGQIFNPHKIFRGLFIPNEIAKLQNLTPLAKLVYGRLLQFSGKSGKCFPSYNTIARELGSYQRGIIRAVHDLEEAALILKEIPKARLQGKKEKNRYFFLWHECFEKANLGPPSDNLSDDTISTEANLGPPSDNLSDDRLTPCQIPSDTLSEVKIFKRIIEENPSNNISCSSSQGDVEQIEKTVLVFPLSKKDQTYPVPQSKVSEWVESYPGINVLLELKKARQWSIDNPSKRKTKSGILRHINHWLSNAQNNASKYSQVNQPAPQKQIKPQKGLKEEFEERRAREQAQQQQGV